MLHKKSSPKKLIRIISERQSEYSRIPVPPLSIFIKSFAFHIYEYIVENEIHRTFELVKSLGPQSIPKDLFILKIKSNRTMILRFKKRVLPDMKISRHLCNLLLPQKHMIKLKTRRLQMNKQEPVIKYDFLTD